MSDGRKLAKVAGLAVTLTLAPIAARAELELEPAMSQAIAATAREAQRAEGPLGRSRVKPWLCAAAGVAGGRLIQLFVGVPLAMSDCGASCADEQVELALLIVLPIVAGFAGYAACDGFRDQTRERVFEKALELPAEPATSAAPPSTHADSPRPDAGRDQGHGRDTR